VKVLYVVTAYPRWEGDVITPWLTETIRRLREVGVMVEVLAPSYRGLGDQEIDGVRVHRFRYAPAAWETLTHDQTAPDRVRERPWYLPLVPAYVIAGCLRARRLARAGGFDVVHVFWPIPHGLIGIAAKKAAGVPLVSTFFGVELTWLKSQLSFLAPLLRWIVRSSDAVTALSSYTAGQLRELVPGATAEIVPFGAAIEDPGSLPRSTAPRPDTPFDILFVGRLVERKGVHVLLEAASLLRSRGREVVVNIVGDGPERPRLERDATRLGIRASVRFHGLVSSQSLDSRMAVCDVLALPAVVDAKGDTEGLGVVLIEALLHGKPVIASGIGGIVDIVQDGDTGLLVPPNDPAALAQGLERLMSDSAWASSMAMRGQGFVRARFSWDGIIERLKHLYEEAAGAGADPHAAHVGAR
jgi:glycosyltransferase involved in cell wall biosynthesis